MSAAGILRPDEVVFYHPLDNVTEHTQSQAWTGTGGFTAGKIGNANSAVTADAASFGTAQELGSGTGFQPHGGIANLGGGKVVAAYETGSIGHARVVTVSGLTFTMEPSVQVASNTSGQGVYCTALSSSVVVFASRGTELRVGSVSGTEITLGPQVNVGGIHFNAKAIKLTSTRFVLIGSIFGGTGRDQMASVGEISGLTITMGSAVTVSPSTSAQFLHGHDLDSSRVLICYTSTSTTGIMCRVATASGLSLTLGLEHQADASGTNAHATARLTSTKFLVLYAQPKGYAVVGEVSGNDITFGLPAQWITFSGTGYLAAATLDSTHVACIHSVYGASGRDCRIATVSGMDVTFGGTTSISTLGDKFGVGPVDAATFFVSAGDSSNTEGAVGVLGMEASMTAPTPGAYPSTIGDTRVVAAMWATKLTVGSSTVTVERGYKIDMTATSVSLGGTTAVWSDAGISSLMSTMNDGSDHLLVLDFENTGGTNWNLRTSVDGAAFTNQGSQDSGTQIVTTADTDPKLTIADGADGQWVDELVLWSGDKATFERFTSEELANLNDLADTFGEAMDQYEENFGAPICWQATARMPGGTVWRDSGSGPCPAVIRVPRGATDIVVTDDGRPVSPGIVEG